MKFYTCAFAKYRILAVIHALRHVPICPGIKDQRFNGPMLPALSIRFKEGFIMSKSAQRFGSSPGTTTNFATDIYIYRDKSSHFFHHLMKFYIFMKFYQNRWNLLLTANSRPKLKLQNYHVRLFTYIYVLYIISLQSRLGKDLVENSIINLGHK